MKSLNTILLALGALAGTTALHAQTAVVKIPFDFTVAAETMPAGEYTLKCATVTCDTIKFVNRETFKSAVVLMRGKNAPHGNEGASGKLTFHRYGEEYYFAGVWTPSGLHGDVPLSPRERSASNGSTQTATVSIPVLGTR